MLEANKRIGSAGLVTDAVNPWAATLRGLTAANSRPNHIVAGGGDLSSQVMQTLQPRERPRIGIRGVTQH